MEQQDFNGAKLLRSTLILRVAAKPRPHVIIANVAPGLPPLGPELYYPFWESVLRTKYSVLVVRMYSYSYAHRVIIHVMENCPIGSPGPCCSVLTGPSHTEI